MFKYTTIILLCFCMQSTICSENIPVWEEYSNNTHKLPAKEDIIGDYSSLFNDIIECLNSPHDDCEKGYIFHGHPGTGKSTIPLALANSTDGICLKVSGAIIENKMQGSGPEMINMLFQRAKDLARYGQKVIIFIDEIDTIGVRNLRPEHNSEANKCLTQLLVELDNLPRELPINVIGATNYRDKLDHALTRDERLTTIQTSLPNQSERIKILNHYSNKYQNLRNSPEFLAEIEQLARDTKDFTPASLKKLITGISYKLKSNTLQASVKSVYESVKRKHLENIKCYEEKKNEEKVRFELDKKCLEEMKWRESKKGKAWEFAKFVGGHTLSFLIGQHTRKSRE